MIEDLSVEDILDSYFIGMWKEIDNVLDHEVAHAFFATIPAYKAEQMKNLSEFPPDLYKEMSGKLVAMGYHPDVVQDEMQAYLSSYVDNLEDVFDNDTYKDYSSPFVEALQRYRALNTPT